ncbi:hypothetical protein [Streptomyces sp. AM8-1-1]|uniref:hypothetical protein n=1 Tax=Streptomyces sp. AM8-1-1 TaxID=3075825 RepID=UPI0028C3E4D7|nr:hypothetical protein [Streptomyces sp. AM8-1-1]WNO71535.1 hypothetical protein RPQ07_07775 [Streptomyces sp. AM8-1-1]
MPENDPADPVTDHFGAEGLRRFPAASLAGVLLPDDSVRAVLSETGVPMAVGPGRTPTP